MRAQLADCLVGVCCQRLEFLSAQRLRVPRCEILLPTSGARGTIRAGNFSQIADCAAVGRRGGHVDLRALSALDGAGDRLGAPALVRGPARARGVGAACRAGAARDGAAPPRREPRARGPAPPSRPASRGSGPAEEIIEVPAEDMDLAALAELAKKAIERKT